MHRHHTLNALPAILFTLLRATLPVLLAAVLLSSAARAQDLTPTATPEAEASPTPAASLKPIPYESSFTEVECPFVVPWDQEITCGMLSVPENRYNPDYDPETDTLKLFVSILKSHNRPEADPILVLPGGPGAAASPMRSLFMGLALRDNRDILLLDPRGTGYSEPALDCPEVGDTDAEYESGADAYRACYDRLLAEGRDLSGYSSAEMTEDVADLAKVLGIGSLNLYATSYGSRVAMLLADRYPSLVRSMVLDGATPVSANSLLEEPLNIYGVFRRIAQDCAIDRQCNGTYPALEARLLEVIDRYNRTPLPAVIGYGSGENILQFILDELASGGRALPAFITALYDEDFPRACAALPAPSGCQFEEASETNAGEDTGGDAVAGVDTEEPEVDGTGAAAAEVAPWRTLLTSPEDAAGPDAERISWLMNELEFESPEALFEYLDTLTLARAERLVAEIPAAREDFQSEGVYASVLCSEEGPFYSTADVAEVAQRIPAQFGDLSVRRANEVAELCAFWQTPAVSPARKVMQTSITPTLITAGTHDAVTPPAWARLAAAYLEQSEVHLFPGYGHAILAGGDACMLEMMTDFYANPQSRPAQTCSDDLALRFYFADEEEPAP